MVAMERLLVQSRASKSDPSFADQIVEDGDNGILFTNYFRRRGIKLLIEETIESCHGNPEYSREHAEQLKALAKEGHKVVGVYTGGMQFARPGLEAAIAITVPILSVPTDLDAFLAPRLPAGPAAIAGVSIKNYQAAAYIAREIQVNEYPGIYLLAPSPGIEKKLKELDVPFLGIANSGTTGLVIGETALLSDCMIGSSGDRINIVALQFNVLDVFLVNSILSNMRNTAYVGEKVENTAIFAAKIMASYNSNIREALLKVAQEKAASYRRPNLTLDAFA